ncbi:hypothetical protein KA005_18390 [bacterium]|nr:hypothetical protein [bacterium]
MAKTVPFLRGSTGLNTVDDPTRINYSSKSGISDLATAVNVTLSPSGRPNRRTGKTLRIPLGSHSLFCDGGECVFVHDSGLYLLETNFSYRLLRSLSNNNHMAYAQVGDRIYFTNNQDMGYVEAGIACTWAKTTNYVGPVTQKIFTGPPPGNHLAFRDGRIYITTGNIVWYSEFQALDWFDMHRNRLHFNTHVRMVKPVSGGIYISSSRAIYFFSGPSAPEFEQKKVTSYPALEWSDAIDYLDGTDVSEMEIAGLCALWTTPEGAMLGTPEGMVINLNKKKVIYPHGTKGASLLRGLNFIHTIE